MSLVFSKIIKIRAVVLEFVNKLKCKLKLKYPDKCQHLKTLPEDHNFYNKALKDTVMIDQKEYFPEIFQYFASGNKALKAIPNLVNQLNIYLDQSGLLRMKSMCEKMKSIQKYGRYQFPLLISKNSLLTNLIIKEFHVKLCHAGVYTVIAELRKSFWIPHVYSSVKKCLSHCIICRKVNARPIQVNQSPYREMRLDPSNTPFFNIYLDYIGPFTVKNSLNQNSKVYILCVSCMWSRAINLKMTEDLSTEEFLRALQLHSFNFGTPAYCISDMRTQIIAGANQISTFLNDPETRKYLKEHKVESVKFDKFFKGKNGLGGLIESCVKLTKRLIYGVIGKNIINHRDFEFVVAKTKHLINRRPVAFKDLLRDSSDIVPEVITPEMLLYGRELVSLNIIPNLQEPPDKDPEWCNEELSLKFSKLHSVLYKLKALYADEFIGKLIYQAVNERDRYKPVSHNEVRVGDIVLLKEVHTNPINFPLGRVKQIVKNTNNEVTGVIVMKGKNREIVKRHNSTIVPLLTCDIGPGLSSSSNIDQINERPKRKAGIASRIKTRQMLVDDL